MSNERKCSRCGGTAFEPGLLHSSGDVSFRVQNARHLSMGSDSIAVQAVICMGCGGIDLAGDVAMVVALIGGEARE